MTVEKFDFDSLDESGVVVVEEEPSADNQPDVEVVVEEPAVDEEDVEEVADDDGVEEQTPDPEPAAKEEKEPYTEEEIQQILQSDGEIDTTRLSPAEQATMKAMQRGFTPKLQEAAELRKEVKELREAMEQAKPKEQPADIYEAYDQDPEGVIRYVDNQINDLVATDPVGNMANIRQLESLKFDFNRREVQKIREQSSTQTEQNQIMSQILSAVPDLAVKQHALKEFALQELGYTEEELAYETNPATAGAKAARSIARINTAFDKAQAKKTVTQKRTKKKPTKVETPSKSGYDKPDVDELKITKQEALESGNFSAYFAALGDD